MHAGDQEIAEYDSSGGLLRRFVPGADFGEIIVTVETSGQRSFHHEDGLGSTVARSNDAGLTVEINSYGPFGEGAGPGGTNAFGFTGQRYDAESGLYHFRARAYSPALGRFLQPDPAGFVDGLNLYAYAGNSPLSFVDPLGLAAIGRASSTRPIYKPRRGFSDRLFSSASRLLERLLPGFQSDIRKLFKNPIREGRQMLDSFPATRSARVATEGAGLLLGVLGTTARSGKQGLGGNPFLGKTPAQLDEMFKNKGFDPRGPDPVSGLGGYKNPRTGRSYHIDQGREWRKGPEQPHVDVNYLRNPFGFKKRKFPLGR